MDPLASSMVDPGSQGLMFEMDPLDHSQPIHISGGSAPQMDIPPPSVIDAPQRLTESDIHEPTPLNSLEQYSTSPPWSWSWGDLPARRKEDVPVKPVAGGRALHKMVSTPVMNQKTSLAPSSTDIVENYLSGLPEEVEQITLGASQVAISQDLDSEAICLEMLGADSSHQTPILVSRCGPIGEFLKLSPEVLLIFILGCKHAI